MDYPANGDLAHHVDSSTPLNGTRNGNFDYPKGATSPVYLAETVVKDTLELEKTHYLSVQPRRNSSASSDSGCDSNGENGINTYMLDRNCNPKAGDVTQLTSTNKTDRTDEARVMISIVGPKGGTLVLQDPSSGKPIQLIIGQGALKEYQTINMEVEKSEFSPRIKLRPSETTFMKPVRLIFPVNKSASFTLCLRNREDETSEWKEDPVDTPYFEHDGTCTLELRSFSDNENPPMDEGLQRKCTNAKIGRQFYGNDRLVFGVVDSSGGTLVQSDPISGRPIQLIIGQGALEDSQLIHMEVEASEFSPRFKLRPPGTMFKKPVRLTFPVSRGELPLNLRKRADETSEWYEDPVNTPYLVDDDTCTVELLCFSDYEMAPCKALGVTMLIFIQDATTQTGFGLRLYLAKESKIKKIDKLERGLSGVSIRREHIYVQDAATIHVGKLDGFTSFDPNITRVVSRSVLEANHEYGTAFIFQCDPGINKMKAEFVLERDHFLPVPYGFQFDRPRHDLTPETRALGRLDSDLVYIRQPDGVFPLMLIENLVSVLEPVIPDSASALPLAEAICMPGPKPFNTGRLKKFSGSPARIILEYYQYLCLEKKMDTETGLQTLRQHLESLGFKQAVEAIQEYECQKNDDSANQSGTKSCKIKISHHW